MSERAWCLAPVSETRPGPLLPRLGRVALVLLGALALILPGLLPCPMAAVLRLPCPGCGMTRATFALLRGDLAGMLRFHPLAPLILLFLGGYLGGNTLGYLTTGRWGWLDARIGPRGNLALWALVTLVFGVWVARFAGLLGGPVPV